MYASRTREARQHPRYAVHCKASAQELSDIGTPSEEDEIQGEVHNISRGGFCITLKRACRVSSVLKCDISFPGVPVSIPTLAQVRWSHKGSFTELASKVGVELLARKRTRGMRRTPAFKVCLPRFLTKSQLIWYRVAGAALVSLPMRI
jgi:hypothetical protein